jgi:hypothetical protein
MESFVFVNVSAFAGIDNFAIRNGRALDIYELRSGIVLGFQLRHSEFLR